MEKLEKLEKLKNVIEFLGIILVFMTGAFMDVIPAITSLIIGAVFIYISSIIEGALYE